VLKLVDTLCLARSHCIRIQAVTLRRQPTSNRHVFSSCLKFKLFAELMSCSGINTCRKMPPMFNRGYSIC